MIGYPVGWCGAFWEIKSSAWTFSFLKWRKVGKLVKCLIYADLSQKKSKIATKTRPLEDVNRNSPAWTVR